MREVLSILALAGCTSAHDATSRPNDGSTSPGTGDGGTTCSSSRPIDAILGHNTSANSAYNRTNFSANFGTSTWISQAGATMPVDPNAMDLSLNPVTPGHVSGSDVHTLIPSRPDLRWFAHMVPWFGRSNHIDIGVVNDTMAYVSTAIADMKSRGFDGLIVDWYGSGSYSDDVLLLIQNALQADPNNTFTFIVMMDKGIANLSQSVLETQIDYVRTQYFGDPNYEREGTKPILMFFGVEAVLQPSGMAAVKAADGTGQVWVVQGTGSLSQSWDDQAFDWTHDYHNGPSTTDPYNLADVSSYYANVAKSSKHAFGSMTAGFNGMLTKTVAWSKGKYLPRGHGACVVQWAQKIDAVIPSNVTRMQWATWSDWEEGSEIESGVENDVGLTATIAGSSVSWAVTGGTGDESTIDHYEIYATTDATNAIDLGSAPVGATTFDLGCLTPGATYSIAIVAVGRPTIRDHVSAWLPYTVP